MKSLSAHIDFTLKNTLKDTHKGMCIQITLNVHIRTMCSILLKDFQSTHIGMCKASAFDVFGVFKGKSAQIVHTRW